MTEAKCKAYNYTDELDSRQRRKHDRDEDVKHHLSCHSAWTSQTIRLYIFSLPRYIYQLLPAGMNKLMAMTNSYLQTHIFSTM